MSTRFLYEQPRASWSGATTLIFMGDAAKWFGDLAVKKAAIALWGARGALDPKRLCDRFDAMQAEAFCKGSGVPMRQLQSAYIKDMLARMG